MAAHLDKSKHDALYLARMWLQVRVARQTVYNLQYQLPDLSFRVFLVDWFCSLGLVLS